MSPPEAELPPPPYPGLAAYGADGRSAHRDAALFFGRDAERAMVMANLRGARLTVLHGPSGVGKSSLLRAGVAHAIRRLPIARGRPRPLVVVADRWRDASAEALLRAIADEAARMRLRPPEPGLEHRPLPDALAVWCEALSLRLLLVLDQFEDHFLYHPPDADRLDRELPEALERPELPVHVLLGIRDDALADLDRFEGRVLGLFENRLRLEPLSEAAARAAIAGPVRAYNAAREPGQPEVRLQDGLPERIVAQLHGRIARGEGRANGAEPVEPAYLQLVMTRLWTHELRAGSHVLRVQTLAAMGGVPAIVRGHVDEAVGGLPGGEPELAARAFHHLVTPSGRKIAQSIPDLAGYAGVPEERLAPVLERLASPEARVLRALPPPPNATGPRRYEVFHDVLAEAVLDWRTRHAERRLRRRTAFLAATVAALAVVALGSALYAADPGWLRRLELATVDARFDLRGGRAPLPDMVFVDVDRRSLDGLPGDGDRLRRDLHAQAIDRLLDARAAVVGFDVWFADRWLGDRALLDAAGRAGPKLVLATEAIDPEGRTALFGLDPQRTADRLRELRVEAAYTGLPFDPADPQQRFRWIESTVALEGRAIPVLTFAQLVAEKAQPELRFERATDRAWIDYRGPAGTFPRVSYADLLGGRAGDLAGKVVVVGSSATDRVPTAAGTMPGAEAQLNAIDTVRRDRPLQDVSRGATVLLLLLLGLAPLLLLRLRPVLAASALGALALAYAAAAQLLFHAGHVVAVIPPLGVLAVSTVAVLAVRELAPRMRRRPSRPPAAQGAP